MKKKLLLLCLQVATFFVHAQNVGIGTTTPLARLHITDSSVLFSATGSIPTTAGNTPISGTGRRMMWYSDKAAFRAGYVGAANWDKDSIGDYSFASGYNTKAKGQFSFAAGFNSIANGDWSTSIGYQAYALAHYSTAIGFGVNASGQSATALGVASIASGSISTAIGFNTTASGSISTSLGYYTIARSGIETVIGTCNTDYTPNSTVNWNAADRLFVIGNGSDINSRSDALVVLKNGNTGIGNSTPAFPLSFAPALGDKVSLWSNSTNSYGFGIQSGLLQIHTDVSGADIAFGYGSSTSMTERMRIKGNGNIGIGLTTPNAKLSISANGTELAGTASSNTLRTNAGILGNTAGSEISLASIGFLSTSNSSLGIRAYRSSTGADWTSTALLLGYDVDNTVRVGGGYIALGANGNIGIGAATPLQRLHVEGATFLNGNAGIGTATPYSPLTFNNNTGQKISFYGTAGNNYGIGIQNGLLQIHTDIASSDITFGYGSSNSFTEKMRIMNNVGYDGMILKGRLLLKNGSTDMIGGGGGVWMYKADNSALLGFMGAQNNQNIGFYGGPANGGWGFVYDAINSRVGIGTSAPAATLEVNGYTKLGNDAPSIKVKKLTGTTSPTEGVSVSISLGGLNSAKILSVTAMVHDGTEWLSPNIDGVGKKFYWSFNTFNVTVYNVFGDSGAILSKPIKILITYEE